MSGISNERFFPADPDPVFKALNYAAKSVGKVKSSDAFARSVTIGTGASGFSWGATFSAYVVPVEGGSVVRMGGQATVRTNITAKSAEFKNTIRLLDATGAILQGWQREGHALRAAAPEPPRAASAQPPPAQRSSVATELAELIKMLNEGHITKDEFKTLKKNILAP